MKLRKKKKRIQIKNLLVLNKIIFDKRTKNIIDNNLNSELLTLTLESSRTNKAININDNNNLYNGCLISKRSNGNSSFEKNIYSLMHYKLNKKNDNKNKRIENKNPKKKKNLLNSPSAHRPYIAKIFKKNNYNNSNKELFPKNKKIKKSLYTLAKKNYKNN